MKLHRTIRKALAALGLAAILFMVGSVGAIEYGRISLAQGGIQCAAAFAVLALCSLAVGRDE